QVASAERPTDRYASAIGTSAASLRIGVIRRPYFEDLAPDMEAAVDAAIQALAGISAGVRDVELPYANILMTIASAEAYAFHKSWLGQTPQLYQPMTRQR